MGLRAALWALGHAERAVDGRLDASPNSGGSRRRGRARRRSAPRRADRSGGRRARWLSNHSTWHDGRGRPTRAVSGPSPAAPSGASSSTPRLTTAIVASHIGQRRMPAAADLPRCRQHGELVLLGHAVGLRRVDGEAVTGRADPGVEIARGGCGSRAEPQMRADGCVVAHPPPSAPAERDCERLTAPSRSGRLRSWPERPSRFRPGCWCSA